MFLLLNLTGFATMLLVNNILIFDAASSCVLLNFWLAAASNGKGKARLDVERTDTVVIHSISHLNSL